MHTFEELKFYYQGMVIQVTSGQSSGAGSRPGKGRAPSQQNIHPDESRDPYLNDRPKHEPARCSVCGNVYSRKSWYRADQHDLPDDSDVHSYTCPGCRKIQDNFYLGELRVSGGFLSGHRKEISGLIQNEVHKRQEKNPLSKLVQMDVDEQSNPPEVVFQTTNAKLTEHLGRALKQAFGGELETNKSEPVTRVLWSRGG